MPLNALDRRVFRLAIPAFGTLAAEPLYRLVDTAIVGRIGTDELGGLAIAVTVLSLIVASSNFITYGTTERVARRLGAGREADAANVGVQSLWLAVAVGLGAVPLIIGFARPVAQALGADGAVLEFAVAVPAHLGAVGVPFVVVSLAAQGVQRGASDFRTPLVILLCSNVVNVVVELVLVFGFDMGIAGAAWSTVIAQTGAGIALARRHPRPARAGDQASTGLGRDGTARIGRPSSAVARGVDACGVHRSDRDRRAYRRSDTGRPPGDRHDVSLPGADARRARGARPDTGRRGTRSWRRS